ncbi:BTB/POZ and MATH domain-containing protein 3-like [Papaver somniferum]|uniref:BTB/POZ and MATH domain-containing protein 3-like n=1 Tax=Papaver somniferum TaxID=3469 RepID=UPI000E701872|nr:BTB/POZ and MATH domain-containing protein 3-like [Papaver somniferum]
MAPNAAKSRKVSKSELSSSRLFYETVKGSHEFQINGYSHAKIRFYPVADEQASQEYISVFIEIESPGEVSVLVELKLLDQRREGQLFSKTTSPHTFKAGGDSTWGFKKYVKRSEFETSNYLKDDRLSIHATVIIVQTRFEEDKRYVIPVPPSDMIQNLKGLLKSEIGSDVTFQVANEEFRAHKWILAAGSPVFKAMFYGLVGNPDMDTVVVEEFDPFTFKAMLLFLYSDELPETHELSDSNSPCTSTSIY